MARSRMIVRKPWVGCHKSSVSNSADPECWQIHRSNSVKKREVNRLSGLRIVVLCSWFVLLLTWGSKHKSNQAFKTSWRSFRMELIDCKLYILYSLNWSVSSICTLCFAFISCFVLLKLNLGDLWLTSDKF